MQTGLDQKKGWLVLILTLLLLIVAVEFFYFLRLKKSQVPSLTDVSEVKKSQPSEQEYQETFNWPGWSLVNAVALGDAKGYKFLGPESGDMVNFGNLERFLVKGKFEISFKVTLGPEVVFEQKPAMLYPEGRVDFYNGSDPLMDSFSFIFTKGDPEFVLQYRYATDDGKVEVTSFGKGLMPAHSQLRLVVDEIGNSSGEMITVYDRVTEDPLFAGRIPFVFFQKDSKLGFNFEVGNGIEFMEIEDFLIKPLEKSSLVFLE